MKVISDNKQLIFDRIYKIILCFDDEYEVELNQVREWDFDLDRCDNSYVDFTNVLVDTELVNRFCTDKERIKFIHIEGKGYELDYNSEIIMVDMQCNMRIRKIRLNGDIDSATEMCVQLEGAVK